MFQRLKPRLELRSVLKKRIVYYNTVSNTWNSLLTNKIAWIFFFCKRSYLFDTKKLQLTPKMVLVCFHISKKEL